MSGLPEKAFELAYSQLKGQSDDLRNLRNQASFGAAISGLLAAAFGPLVAGSFSETFFSEESHILGVSAQGVVLVITFSASIIFAAGVMIGWKDCVFNANPEVFLHAHTHARDENEMYADLAKKMCANFEKNESVIDAAKRNLRLCLIFAVAQIPAWLLFL